MSTAVDSFAVELLSKVSPSGLLAKVALDAEAERARREFDVLADEFRADDAALAKIREPSFADRLEDDFALAVPAISDAAVPLEAWAIPLLTGLLGGPMAPFLSIGLQVACKVALMALHAWSKKRLADRAS